MTHENSQVIKGTCLSDRYEVVDHISIKAGRETLLAKDLQIQGLVIVKLVKFGTGIDWNQIKLFEREAKILKTLSHDSIPKYRDYFELNLSNIQGFALVQDYIDAKSLEEQLQAGRRFSEVEIKQLATAILKILIDLHSQKPSVIHRDIKPSNILVKNRSGNHVGEVYLVDFGSVQNLAENQGGTITIVGTYGYMPPEQFGGKASPASDLYSLGATLIYAATGIHPAEIPQKDLRLQFESMVDLTSSFIQWLKQMTEPSLDRRFLSAEEALKRLENPLITTIEPRLKQKPSYSHVVLFKDGDQVRLTIPTKRFFKNWNKILNVSFNLSCIYFILMLVGYLMRYLVPAFNSILGLLQIVIICLAILQVITLSLILLLSLTYKLFVLLYPNLSEFLGTKKLELNFIKKTIHQYYILPFPDWFEKKIVKIEQIELYRTHDQREDFDQVNQRLPLSIVIWAEYGKKYTIDSLTPDELDWLGGELSHLLNLPLVQRKTQFVDNSNNQ